MIGISQGIIHWAIVGRISQLFGSQKAIAEVDMRNKQSKNDDLRELAISFDLMMLK
jgi:hypothetical protein